ncbi:MAG: Gfo/Idh/MocA family protein [Candidatus Limnocylindrales bacterium]
MSGQPAATEPSASAAVGFALVGCGAISTQHFEAIAAVEGAVLVAVESSSIERARAAGERCGVPWTTDLAELLNRTDVEAVAVCTPSGSHAEIALAALRHGKHVVVEKPLALSTADADAVIAEGRRADRLVATISQRRFEPVMQALHAAIAAGGFGRIALIIGEGLYHRPQSYYDSAAWRGTRAMDGGVLMNQAIHMVDLVRWIGGPVASIAGQVATIGHTMEAEDTTTVSLRFASGALGSIVATTCAEPGFDQELRVYGDHGHARIVGQQAIEWSLAPGTILSVPADQPAPDATTTPSGGLAPATWGTDATGHIRQYTDIVEAMRTGRAPAVTGEDGRNAVEIVVGAYQASDTGRAVTLGTRAP